jgi:cytochrome oxidase Cu insertion factor (SCO1/SenC/PrrC family)
VANQARATAADRNPDVDPGTSLPASAAPGFTLTDQYGSRVSLWQFRGQAAGRHVRLLGIDANPDATRVADVRAYSEAHQMMRSWHFLTGSRSQLAAVWRAYHVYVAASHGNIDHEPAVYLIDPQGRERTLYLTQMAYASITQQAQLIAGGLCRLLPGQPALHGSVSMTLDRGIRPATPASLPVIGGDRQAGRVVLGPAHPHVFVFLTSWDSEVSDLTAELRLLAGYQRQALRRGWPSVVAVDESQTETSPAALTRLLALTVGSLVLGVLLIGAFAVAEERVRAPLLPLRVILDRTRAGAYLSVGVAAIALFGAFLFLTYYLQTIKGYSPVAAGLAFLPMVGGLLVSANTSSNVLLPRIGPRILISSGLLTGAAAMAYLTQLSVTSSYAGGVLPALVLLGMAFGMILAPAINTATTGVRPEDSGVAPALVNTMQQVGGSIGASALSTVALSATATYLTAHHASPLAPAAAAVHGYTVAFTVSAVLFAAGAVLVFSLLPARRLLAGRRGVPAPDTAAAPAAAHAAAETDADAATSPARGARPVTCPAARAS